MAVKPPPWITKSQTAQVGPTPFGDRGVESKFSTGKAMEPAASIHNQMHDAFAKAEGGMKVDAAGNGGYGMHPATLKPMRSLGQTASVRKAAEASGLKRALNKGMPKL